MSGQNPHSVVYWTASQSRRIEDRLIAEEPLAIRIEGKPYSVVMRTPGDEIAHAAGFCLAEGIVDAPEDFTSLALCDDAAANVVTATLTPDRRSRIGDVFDRRAFISQTSCGVCGKQLLADLRQAVHPLPDQPPLDPAAALDRLLDLPRLQPLRRETRAAHAAALLSAELELLAAAEDVGRHNALDKAVGKLFLDRRLDQASLLLLSSRISYELVQKAARAGVPVILAVSRPTSLAVDLAAELNVTLACRLRPEGLAVFTAPHRFRL